MAPMNFHSSFFFMLLLFIPIQANIGKFDEYWVKRAAEAQKAAMKAFDPHPEEATVRFNAHFGKRLHKMTNSTRRNLRVNKEGEECVATNPIDRCWRCDKDWEKNRRKLADCVLGFGGKTIGGKNGKTYVVTSAADDDVANPKPGTLRHAVIQKEPLWIVFAQSMIIELKQELIVTSDKTIDGRGKNVHIANGAGITIQFVNNVIIHGLHIHDIVEKEGGMIRDSVDHVGSRTKSDGDGVSIFGSSNIWIDHLSMSNCRDGLIDVIQGSTAITISNCHMTDHNEVMLFGASDSYDGDKKMQITLAFNHFGRGLVQRMPRCRWGFFHVVNNDYTNWLMYAIGGSSNPTIISQGNRFIAPKNDAAKQVTKREYAQESEWKNWQWRSENDEMKNGAFFVQSGNSKQSSSANMITAKPGSSVTRLTRFSGALNCVAGKPC